MRRCAWWLLCLSCARAPLPATEEAVSRPRPQLWVDGSAPAGGNGTQGQPFRELLLRSGATTHLATGVYELSGELPDDVVVVGEGTVVLHGGELKLNRARLTNLAIQGGEVGLRVHGEAALEGVALSGQRKAAIRVEPTGVLRVDGGSIEGSVPETLGISSAGSLHLTGTSFRGALRRGVWVERGHANLTALVSDGVATAVHVSGGEAQASGCKALQGRGPAFVVHGAHLMLRDIEVRGHEFAVQAGQGSVLDVERLSSDRAQVAAVSVLGAQSRLAHLRVSRPGSHGAVESLEGNTVVDDLEVTDATDIALWVRHGRLEAKRVRIYQVRGESGAGGDGVMVRDATALLEDVEVRGAHGTGVVATAVATVELRGLKCSGCLLGALLVERRASVRASRVVSEGAREAAVVVPDDAVLELNGLEAKGNGPAVWAECAPGSRVVLKGQLPPRELLSGACIELEAQQPRGSPK